MSSFQINQPLSLISSNSQLQQGNVNNSPPSSSSSQSNQPQFNQQSQQQQQIQSSSSSSQPIWFQNNLKKRTIPNHLIPKKKPSFQLTNNDSNSNKQELIKLKKSNQSLINSDQFNILSFSNNKDSKKLLSLGSLLDNQSTNSGIFDNSFDLTKVDETINESNEVQEFNDDLPPIKSIYELNEEINQFKNEFKKDFLKESFLNKDPKNFNNVFNKTNKQDILNKQHEKNLTTLDNNCAIIVFGYPESLSLQVIQYFKTFGNILEKFEINKILNDGDISINQINKNLTGLTEKDNQNIPIFTGNNWIKLTFDSLNSALLALQENGTVFNGALLGVVPYHKNTVEKLEKRLLKKDEDLSNENLNLFLQQQQNQNQYLNQTESTIPPSSDSMSNQNYINKLDIKEGSQFFINPENEKNHTKVDNNNDKNKEKLTLISTLSKYIFGFHDL
ncbi:unnamed protein product [Candida verbasci]|uniref:RRM Nup35-type domain-containing protein n=1 Tax=Candida verbasci TaxID=1227364 RepID=A0A9W4TYG6_9ASCO|nr:unnamed protein product [Candida verbasci]